MQGQYYTPPAQQTAFNTTQGIAQTGQGVVKTTQGTVNTTQNLSSGNPYLNAGATNQTAGFNTTTTQVQGGNNFNTTSTQGGNFNTVTKTSTFNSGSQQVGGFNTVSQPGYTTTTQQTGFIQNAPVTTTTTNTGFNTATTQQVTGFNTTSTPAGYTTTQTTVGQVGPTTTTSTVQSTGPAGQTVTQTETKTKKTKAPAYTAIGAPTGFQSTAQQQGAHAAHAGMTQQGGFGQVQPTFVNNQPVNTNMAGYNRGIVQQDNLPKLDPKNLLTQQKIQPGPPVHGVLTLKPLQAVFLKDTDMMGKMDPYIVGTVGKIVNKTDVANNQGTNPVWDNHFSFNCQNDTQVKLQAFDKDLGKGDLLGETDLNLIDFQNSRSGQNWFPLFLKGKENGKVLVAHQFGNQPADLTNVKAPIPVSANHEANAKSEQLHQPNVVHPGPVVNGNLKIKALEGKFSKDMDMIGKMDPYLILAVGKDVQKTEVANNQGTTPKWTSDFLFRCNNNNQIKIEGYDQDQFGKGDFLGETTLNLEDFRRKRAGQDWFPLYVKKKEFGRILLQYDFQDFGAGPVNIPQGYVPPTVASNVLQYNFGEWAQKNPGFVQKPVIPNTHFVPPQAPPPVHSQIQTSSTNVSHIRPITTGPSVGSSQFASTTYRR